LRKILAFLGGVKVGNFERIWMKEVFVQLHWHRWLGAALIVVTVVVKAIDYGPFE